MDPIMMNYSWFINIFLLVVFVIAAFTVDLNGRILGLSETISNFLAIVLVVFGLSVDAFLMLRDKKRRWVCWLIAAIYLILIFPALL
jgi:hypothetical protein